MKNVQRQGGQIAGPSSFLYEGEATRFYMRATRRNHDGIGCRVWGPIS